MKKKTLPAVINKSLDVSLQRVESITASNKAKIFIIDPRALKVELEL